jgi:hypothetical protein
LSAVWENILEEESMMRNWILHLRHHFKSNFRI